MTADEILARERTWGNTDPDNGAMYLTHQYRCPPDEGTPPGAVEQVRVLAWDNWGRPQPQPQPPYEELVGEQWVNVECRAAADPDPEPEPEPEPDPDPDPDPEPDPDPDPEPDPDPDPDPEPVPALPLGGTLLLGGVLAWLGGRLSRSTLTMR